MSKYIVFFCALLMCLTLLSCFSEEVVSVKGVLCSSGYPPSLVDVQSLDEKTVRFVFDKSVEVYEGSFEPYSAVSDGFGVSVTLNESIKAGEKAVVGGRVMDEYGNTTGFSSEVWGYNPNPAGLLINEICTKTEPKTELIVRRAGNTAGLTLYNGTPDSYAGRVILPSLDVKEGDFIVVWFTESISDSVLNAHNVLLDTPSKGFSGNGVQCLSLSPAPGAEVADAVLYSNFSVKYSGYGSAETEKRAKKAVEEGWWNSLEEPIDSSKSTKLRTLCRRRGEDGEPLDTNGVSDWYTAENKGATFGAENTSSEYEP